MDCVKCKKQIINGEDLGVEIVNHIPEELDNFPPRIGVCKQCAIEIAVDLFSGKLPSFSMLGSLMKGLKK